MIDADTLARILPGYLARQRWFAASEQLDFTVEVVEFEVWRDSWPGLVWALVSVVREDQPVVAYQVIVGLRSVDDYPHFLDGKGQWLLGDVTTSQGEALAYDGLVDPDLAVHVFDRIAPDLHVTKVRPLTVEQTNTSIVADERWILKLFRQVRTGHNPDVDLARSLWSRGFTQTPEPIIDWRSRDVDLAVVRRFFPGGTDGFVLAGTSLRDLYDSRRPPESCGGDFAPDTFRLGEMIGKMHRFLADGSGTSAVGTADVVVRVAAELRAAAIPGISTLDIEVWASSVMAGLPDELLISRIHGDLHLGQLLRTDEGWLVLDFEGEPDRPVNQRVAMMSPWRDVGAMLRSFDYAAQVTLSERADDDIDDQLRDLAEQWRVRNRQSFLNGYRTELGGSLAVSDAELEAIVGFFELAKAVYEVGYERGHRPDWAVIPETAVRRLMGETSS